MAAEIAKSQVGYSNYWRTCIFFTWNKGNNFNHVGIVLSWNKTNNILTYVAGNEDGKVAIKTLNLSKKANKDKIATYGEY